jgi:hypothetical protein
MVHHVLLILPANGRYLSAAAPRTWRSQASIVINNLCHIPFLRINIIQKVFGVVPIKPDIRLT